MITLEQCKQILKKDKRRFSDEDIKLIRDYLYQLAKLQLENENK
jgi:hypothetical protein